MTSIIKSGKPALLALAALLGTAACQTSTSGDSTVPPALQLAGTDWVLIEYGTGAGDSGMNEVPPYDYTLTLASGGDAVFKLDCNRGRGSWEASPEGNGGTLSFGPIASTRAMCPPGSIGQQLANDMAAVTAYSIYDGRLTMTLGSSGKTYVWDRVD